MRRPPGRSPGGSIRRIERCVVKRPPRRVRGGSGGSVAGRVRALVVAAAVGGGGCATRTQTGALVGGAGGAAVGAAVGSAGGNAGKGADRRGHRPDRRGAGRQLDGPGRREEGPRRPPRAGGRGALRRRLRGPVRAVQLRVTRDDVVAWARDGKSDDIIIDRIERSDTVFRLTAADEDGLRDQGVSDGVIRAMRDTARKRGRPRRRRASGGGEPRVRPFFVGQTLNPPRRSVVACGFADGSAPERFSVCETASGVRAARAIGAVRLPAKANTSFAPTGQKTRTGSADDGERTRECPCDVRDVPAGPREGEHEVRPTHRYGNSSDAITCSTVGSSCS